MVKSQQPWQFPAMTAPADECLPLAAEFPAATRAQWMRLVDGVLKGAPYDTLVTRMHDGLPIEPLPEADRQARRVVARNGRWQIVQRMDHPDGAAANAEARHDLENGATALALAFAGAIGAHGFGLDPQALDRALDGVHLDAGIALELDLGGDADGAADALARLVKERRYDPGAVDVRFGFDPIGLGAQHGGMTQPWDTLASGLALHIRRLADEGFRGPFVAADGRPVHAAGGSEAQELAFALANAVAYWRALEAGGVAPDRARHMIFFRLAADADQFLTLAKFRAIRKLWARVETACGLAPRPVFVSAETARRMMTRRDPYGNLLRTTIATFAAGLGGADAVSLLPFTAALGLPDRFARRLARNTQLVLLDEAHLARVGDPAAGSAAVEDITAKLCGAAWAIFQEIEAAGGSVAALRQGLIQAKVAAVRQERMRAVAQRRDVITGTSAFPDLAEAAVTVLDVPPPAPSRRQFDVALDPLTPMRLAEPFETLRDRADAHRVATGSPPKVFLATLGRAADFTARAAFAKNFFEAGGIEAVTDETQVASAPDADVGLPALAAAFRASGAKLACLCASDDIYARQGAAAVQALASAGALRVYAAGGPGPSQLVDAIVIQSHSDAPEILEQAQRILGIS